MPESKSAMSEIWCFMKRDRMGGGCGGGGGGGGGGVEV